MSKSKVVKMLELRVANLEAIIASNVLASGHENISKYLENIRHYFAPENAGIELAKAVNDAKKKQAKKLARKQKALEKKLEKQESKASKLDEKLVQKVLKKTSKPIKPAPDLQQQSV